MPNSKRVNIVVQRIKTREAKSANDVILIPLVQSDAKVFRKSVESSGVKPELPIRYNRFCKIAVSCRYKADPDVL